MALTKEERIKVILMSGEVWWGVITADFYNRHQERPSISQSVVAYLIS